MRKISVQTSLSQKPAEIIFILKCRMLNLFDYCAVCLFLIILFGNTLLHISGDKLGSSNNNSSDATTHYKKTEALSEPKSESYSELSYDYIAC